MARENKPGKRDKLVVEAKVSTKGKRKSKKKLSLNTASSSLQELAGPATQRDLQNFSISLNANRIVLEMMDKFDTWYAELKLVWMKVAQGKTWIRRKYYLTRNQYIKSRKNWRRLLQSIQYLIIHHEDLKIILVGLTCLWFENLCKGPGLLYLSIRQQHYIESPLRMLSSISRYSWGNVSIKDIFTGTSALKTERDFRNLKLSLAAIHVMDMSQARTSLTNIQKDLHHLKTYRDNQYVKDELTVTDFLSQFEHQDLHHLKTYRDNQYVKDELTVTDFLSQFEHQALQPLKTSIADTSIVKDLAGTLSPNAQAEQQLMTKKATTSVIDDLKRTLSLYEQADNIGLPIVAESIFLNINTDNNIIIMSKLYDDGNMLSKLLCSGYVRVGEKQSIEMYAMLNYIYKLIPHESIRSSQRFEHTNYKNISDYYAHIEQILKTKPEQNSEGSENVYDNNYKNEDTFSEKLFAKLQNVERQRLATREKIQSRDIQSFPRRFTSRLLHEEDIRNYFEIGLEQTKATGLLQQQYGLPPSVSWPLGHAMLQYKIRFFVLSMYSNAYMERLQTFLLGRNINEKVWPDYCIVRPEPLVNAGFSYAGVQSNVVCDNCGFETNTEDWSDDDDDYAITIHRRTPKECPFLRGKK
ncbi:uncharacterized protein [Mytilus edulis]|uniref:uncharacterized protein n=1 Tax=Mytilus edulis TaxID=6550 RepID=UPI0039EF28C8